MEENPTELSISHFINASPEAVWKAWSDPELFAKWWIPVPIECKVVKLNLTPGGGFETLMRQPGNDWEPHLEACFLEVVPEKQWVFSTVLAEGWRPATPWLALTAFIAIEAKDGGTLYTARVLHRNAEDSAKHESMGFHKGWGLTLKQLASVAEQIS